MILCGGAGTRLWPLSRQAYPKQLLRLLGKETLLQQTARRVSGTRFSSPLVVSGEDQRFFITRQLERIGVPVQAVLLEPEGRNTSAAATLAAAWLTDAGSDELMLLMPSDHVIEDRDSFFAAIEKGLPHAQQGAIVTFGAEPTEPNTQYGYIEAATDGSSDDGVFPIARFVEKPDAATARDYIASGRFFWNAGIFLMKASTLLEEMRQFLPSSLDAITAAVSGSTCDGLFVRPEPAAFASARNISIDHGIMEKTSHGVVVPVQMQWSDIGAWDAVWRLGEKDEAGNVVHGDVVLFDTRNSLVRSDGGPLVAALGLDNIAVIAVPDAVLVAPLDRASDVKNLVAALKAEKRECVSSPARVERPWDSLERVLQGPGFQVRHIVVDPGESLSVQTHHDRSEHWIVVSGSAEVTVGERVSMLEKDESIYIPLGTKHRLANPGKIPLELVEVQCRQQLG
ncbi:MAG TPA: mannose-1-phosphate guanylyltransferase/mannose-6-phosphate isomerase, partial [Acidobacteriaceae bacterium]|nr:mannose-1-phosphate guanylyltransferase/mannose-6-phosphate isomerase [Acidobacteriaceae bacterium]